MGLLDPPKKVKPKGDGRCVICGVHIGGTPGLCVDCDPQVVRTA